MSYFQLIEVETSRYEDMERLHEAWLAETEGVRTSVQEWVCEDRDRPGTYLVIVEFPSVDAAAVNNDLAATAKIARGLAELASSPPTFRNLDMLRHD